MTDKKEKGKRGRPSAITDEVFGKLVEAFKRDATIKEACSYAGIHIDTYYEHLKNDKHFSDEMHDAQMFPHLFAKTKYFEAMESKDTNTSLKAALEYLKRRNEERKDKSENVNINQNTETLSDEDRAILEKIAKRKGL